MVSRESVISKQISLRHQDGSAQCWHLLLQLQLRSPRLRIWDYSLERPSKRVPIAMAHGLDA